jgi:uncharacterized lipoprotein YmbA
MNWLGVFVLALLLGGCASRETRCATALRPINAPASLTPGDATHADHRAPQ